MWFKQDYGGRESENNVKGGMTESVTVTEMLRASNPSSVEVDKMGEKKPTVVVIMGPTGSGKSKLAIDLAFYFPIEIINADSMQVYQGLDILTNKVPLSDQKGVPHHLLGTISPNVEFTAKEFRDSAIPLINDIISRNRLPVVIGGTNYYIQALVSLFLLDDSAEDVDESFLGDSPGYEQPDKDVGFIPEKDDSKCSYDHLKDIDPVAANRIHPNNHRKISQYLSLYAQYGVLPSKLFQGKAAENWGQVDNLRYSCCFVCVDASLSALDRYVEQRVDCMMGSGLLNEVYDIYNLNADYTRGLRQAIGVREFESFLRTYVVEGSWKGENELTDSCSSLKSMEKDDKMLKENLMELLNSSRDIHHRLLLEEAIEKVKVNTRRLVRRQKRMLKRLQQLFGWNIHYVDSTESLSSKSDDIWAQQVVEPARKILGAFLSEDESLGTSNSTGGKMIQRDLWTQYICKACGNRVLRGAHEWEQHKLGRGHRKRISSLRKKLQGFCILEEQSAHMSTSKIER
ncbi:tRNA dimethylallyltransferase 2 [Quillaja saponaria]|uniref:tRNA dimethylallyltransferase 2 n=1 Tax=Quillaja saponaria TaxID=32244 RepID=A0AAD7VM63_QUISA|nr:tRNA dimethylallyltransferase 2 [Quillaja saponaria]